MKGGLILTQNNRPSKHGHDQVKKIKGVPTRCFSIHKGSEAGGFRTYKTACIATAENNDGVRLGWTGRRISQDHIPQTLYINHRNVYLFMFTSPRGNRVMKAASGESCFVSPPEK